MRDGKGWLLRHVCHLHRVGRPYFSRICQTDQQKAPVPRLIGLACEDPQITEHHGG